MKKFIVVREYTDPDKEPKVIGQFSTKKEKQMSSYGILWGFVGYIRLMTRCGNGRIRGKPHGADAPPQPNGQKTMITIAEEQICGGCKHHVYHFSPISQDYDYYTCRLHRCPSKCNQGINN